MAAGVMDIVLILIVLGGAYYVLKSGMLTNIAPAPIAAAPVIPTDGTTPVVPADGTTPTTTTPTTTTPASTGNPLLDALNGLLGGGTGGTNTIPPISTPTQGVPIPQQPIYQGNPAECKSRYSGKCDTECKSGNSSLCQACQVACGGAAVGAVNVLPSQGGTNQSLCKSKYNGKCDTECKGGNSSECSACKSACGSFGAYAYYVKTPQSLMTTTVFGNDHHSYYSSFGNIGVQNAR